MLNLPDLAAMPGSTIQGVRFCAWLRYGPFHLDAGTLALDGESGPHFEHCDVLDPSAVFRWSLLVTRLSVDLCVVQLELFLVRWSLLLLWL